jgi:hypothetical protein
MRFLEGACQVGIKDKPNKIAQMTRNAVLRVLGLSLSLNMRDSHLATTPVIKADMSM